ncbi:LLM class flavin-dependent oxidoreductase [Paractinoplanes atraurantiacus]|uniref:Luciferase-like monooxygenase n=1 Tax=Paractinoplanes atraurantiacus TaxID=1036182 RepID=A0A285IIK0_9ACTN|nr:LLM class flavin-dependent oxidoreductase [Actinoplanes atraurantiacus]SNY47799.1 Luciferase-like monooxygenase [Actinoplanes atraurantiacus]
MTVALKDLGRAADDCGLHTLWVADHLIQADLAAKATDPMLEAYSILCFLSAVTSRVRLGAMVSPVTFRAPALLIKTVTTLDVLSGGRAWLGLGAGYQADEAAAIGLPLPPAGERFRLLEETLRLACAVWNGDSPLSHPAPVSRPPILIGGAGEQRTLRLMAAFAARCATLRSYGMDHVVVITRGRPVTPRDVELVAQAPGLIS